MAETLRRAPVGSAVLQELIDELAESLGRSVALADPQIRGICSSRHFGDADPARVYSLLQGRAGHEVARHVLDQGVAQWSRPGFVAGRDDLGLLTRYCVPLRERGHFLGLLTIVVPDARLDPEAIDAVARATPAIAGRVYAEQVLAHAEKRREQELLLALLGPDPAARAEARRRLVDDMRLPDAPHAVVGVVQLAGARVSPGQVSDVLRGVVEDSRRTRSAHGVFAVLPDRAVLLQLADRPLTPEQLQTQSRRILEGLGTCPDASAAPVVGTGGHQTGLAGARTSHEQALVAVRAARRMPSLKGVGSWEELGELAVLLHLPDRALNESLLPGPLRALLESGCGPRLEETLRCFLDQAGSVPRAAEALRIHRTSLYYRLRQIQEITGLDLDNGADRITLHLGLRTRELLMSLGASGGYDGDGRRPGRAAAPGNAPAARTGTGPAARTPGSGPRGGRSARVRRERPSATV
ncbi:PucR family transcriptional regulator [Streptomyces sp. NPDC048718]|uniref:PucR family transcriptional regulator n=1 Tax=Streptomyces sp. NPDC048718 TaxID=3365587 RepID=UPI003717F997